MKTNFRTIFFLLLPALLLLSIFMLIPIIASLYMSFHKVGLEQIIDWSTITSVGFENYKQILFEDEIFRKAAWNTFKVLIVAMPLTIFLSLGLAVLLNSKLAKFKGFYRTCFYLPAITNTVAVAVVWKSLLGNDYGFINYLLSFFTDTPPQWLSDPKFAIFSVIMLVVWKAIGPNTIIILAGLQSVPEAVIEAADIDGANGIRKFWHITIPIITPTITYISLMIIIGYMQLFEEPYMLTKGGPLDSTVSVVMQIYREGFINFNFAYASALSFMLFIGIFIFSLIRIKLSKNN